MQGQMGGQWHPDPTGRHQLRWWDGQMWTDFVADGGVTAIDPVAGSPAPRQGLGAAQPVAQTPVVRQVPMAYAGAPVQYQPYALAPVVGNERVPAGIPLSNPWARLGSSLLDVVLLIVTLFIGWLVWTLIVWSKGQTPGKQICGQRVVMKRTGRAATWGEMAVRDFVIRGLAVGILGPDHLRDVQLVAALMIFSTYHETMWDKWGGHARRRRPRRPHPRVNAARSLAREPVAESVGSMSLTPPLAPMMLEPCPTVVSSSSSTRAVRPST